MSFTERLALVISARADQALKEIRKVRGEVAATGGGFKSVVGNLGETLKSNVAGGVAAAGAAVAAFAVNGVQSFLSLAEEVRNFQRTSGASAEESSRFVAVLDDLKIASAAGATALFKLGREVAAGAPKLAEYGVEVAKNANGTANLTETLLNVADAYANAPDQATRTAIAFAAFGKQAQTLLPLLEKGRKGLEEFFAGAEEHGQILSQDDLDKARELELAMDDLQDAMRGVQIIGAKALTPFLTDVADVAAQVGGIIEAVQKKSGGLLGDVGTGVVKNFLGPLGSALDLLPGKADKAAGSAEKVGDAAGDAAGPMGKLGDETESGAEIAKRFADTLEDVFDATRRASDAEQDHGDSVRSFESALAGVTDAEQELADARRDRTDASRDAISAERALNSLEDANRGVTDAEKELAKAREGRGETAREITDAEKAVTEAQRDYNAVAGKGGDDKRRAAERLAEARERLAEVSEDGGRERDVADATEALSRAQLDAKDAALSIAKAKEEQAERERTAAERIATAERGVETARNGAKQAALGLADSEAQLAALRAAAQGKPFGPVEQYNAYREALIRLKDTTAPGSDLRRNLEAVINTLPEPAYPIQVTADTSQARAELEALGTLVESVRGQTANVLAGLGLPAAAPASPAAAAKGPLGTGSAATTINITQNINGDSDTPLKAVLDQANANLGWTLARLTGRR